MDNQQNYQQSELDRIIHGTPMQAQRPEGEAKRLPKGLTRKPCVPSVSGLTVIQALISRRKILPARC